MTVEEITQTLQTVAENQARHDERQLAFDANMAKLEEAHARHTADVAEIDKQIAAIVESQTRHDRQLARIFEAIGKNEERFLMLADGMRRLEGSYELLESFVRGFREESRDYFSQTDRKLAALADVQMATADLVAGFVKDTNGRFAETDKKLASLAESQSQTDGQIKALVLAQTRTDEIVRALVEHNGSSKTKPKKAAKKARKGAAK
jgi:chromosome segregation ATPase